MSPPRPCLFAATPDFPSLGFLVKVLTGAAEELGRIAVSVGDVHPSVGDGELSGGGYDVPADVVLRVGLRKGLGLRWPRIERDGCVIATGAHADPLETMRIAVEEMVDLLGACLQLGRADALMLLSVRGDVRVCTCRNHPEAGHTTRVSFPELWSD